MIMAAYFCLTCMMQDLAYRQPALGASAVSSHVLAGSFMQANLSAFSAALRAIGEALPAGAQRLLEMHAGVGAIGLSLMGHEGSSLTHLRQVM
jgi:tRNA/tmRNA/rRNA uracil-C5-methylase (TrmA/RlmC/RlmD family)